MEENDGAAEPPKPATDDADTQQRTPGEAATSEDAPIKVCPHCSVQSTTAGDYCPHCGASFVHGRKGLSKRTKVIVFSIIGVLVLAGAGVGVAQKISHDNQVTEDKQRAEAAAKAAAAQRRQEEAAATAAQDAQDEKDEIERSLRRSSVREMRKSITKDAKKRVAAGDLDGPIYGTQCNPVGGGSVSNLDASAASSSALRSRRRTATAPSRAGGSARR